jgi:FMN hydrolase / 5-amino-6-(5-phospho-D-ribitylamino)uracil phosphatase
MRCAGFCWRAGMRSKRPIRAVFFDLDDTLCDTSGTREARARLAFEAIARKRSELELEAFVARVMETTGDRIVRGVPAVVEELGLGGSEAGQKAIGTWFFEGCIDLLRVIEGVPETVDRLRGDYALGGITNGNGKLQRLKWLQLNLRIELVVVSGDCGFEKPDPRIFAHALELSGVEAREAVFVGDRLDVDIAGAKRAGMRAVWFNDFGGSVEGAVPEPDAVIERFSELPSALAAL